MADEVQDRTLERSRALTQEHEPHGWFVQTPLFAVHDMVRKEGYYMNCSCGWRGWVVQDPEHPIRETYAQDY